MKTKQLVAEFIGTFALIFVGAGAAAIGHANLLDIALAHGLVVMAFIYAYGDISGTHINPAVTLGFLIAGEIKFIAAIGYWVGQCLGGISAAALLKVVLPTPGNLGATILADGISVAQGLLIEAVLTFFLVNTIFTAALIGKAKHFAGLAIGLVLVALILMGGPLTGASFNPARTLGPAIVSNTYTDIWIYFVGPFGGAALAALLHIAVLKEKDAA